MFDLAFAQPVLPLESAVAVARCLALFVLILVIGSGGASPVEREEAGVDR